MKKILNFLIGITIVLGILYLSKFILSLLNIVFPAPILGIIILFTLLKLNIIKEEFVKDFCNFIIKYMILFFIPMFVGLINHLDLISKNLIPILATIFITTAFVIVLVGLFVYNATKYTRLHNLKKGQK
ncbi:MAG: CidA/LrgA family protein [Candidatus Gastranaerophilales bacterium]|nr:CidA/LrgA family protein [Candidatus Gastranaerophilales bacterium]